MGTFNFSRWKAGVMTRLRLAHRSPSKVVTPNCRIWTRGFSGGFTKSPFLSTNINLINSGSPIISLGLVSIQLRETFPEKFTNESVSGLFFFLPKWNHKRKNIVTVRIILKYLQKLSLLIISICIFNFYMMAESYGLDLMINLEYTICYNCNHSCIFIKEKTSYLILWIIKIMWLL